MNVTRKRERWFKPVTSGELHPSFKACLTDRCAVMVQFTPQVLSSSLPVGFFACGLEAFESDSVSGFASLVGTQNPFHT